MNTSERMFVDIYLTAETRGKKCFLQWIENRTASYIRSNLDVELGRLHDPLISLTIDQLIARSITPSEECLQSLRADLNGQYKSVTTIWKQYPIASTGLAIPGEPSRAQASRMVADGRITRGILQAISNEMIGNACILSVWNSLGDILAREAGQYVVSSENSSEMRAEGKLISLLALAHFFKFCRLRRIGDVNQVLRTQAGGIHGTRGGFMAIVHRVGVLEGVLDQALPEPVGQCVSSAAPLPRATYNTLLLDLSCQESLNNLQGKGVLSRFLDPFRQSIDPTRFKSVVEITDNDREIFDRQYSSCISAYLYIVTLEEVLRSTAEHLGVNHLKSSSQPSPVSEWLGRLNLSTGLQKQLSNVFDSRGANIRNRIVHCGLLDPGPGAQEARLASYGVASASNSLSPESPETIASYCQNALADLLNDIHAKGFGQARIGWAHALGLNSAELAFIRGLPCDIFKDAKNLAYWYSLLGHYINITIPCMGFLPNLLFLNYMKGIGGITQDNLVLFLAWGLLFEALFRTTVSLHGFPVVQASIQQGGQYHFQYQMLDQKGLCSPEIIEALVEHVSPECRSAGRKTLEITVQLRNTLSHGALLAYQEEHHIAYNSLFMKAMQLLVESGLHAMTKVSAYHRWENLREKGDTHSLDDYYAARREVLGKICSLGDFSPYEKLIRMASQYPSESNAGGF